MNTGTYAHELAVPGDFPTIREALAHAVENEQLDVKVTVAPGHSEGPLQGNLGVFENALIVAEQAYRARIESIDVGSGDRLQNVTFEGFEIGDASGIVIKLDGGRTTDENVHHVTFRNNVIHDSGSNDAVKVNAAAHHITFERNVLYGHHDDTMDLNSVQHVYVRDNIFFDATGGARNFIVVKDSTPIGEPDFFEGTKYAYVQRNVFLSWKGEGNSSMVYLGEDNDRDVYAVQTALIENNLFIGNGPVGSGFAAPIGLRGVRDITIRNNTFTGPFAGGKSWAFLAWAITSPELLRTEDLYVYNNIWSSADGVQTERFSKSDADQVGEFLIDHNLYWNGGAEIPQSDQGVLNYTEDGAAIFEDPQIPVPQAEIELPTWDRQGGQFADGSTTICEAFDRLVEAYAVPAQPSAVLSKGIKNVEVDDGDESSLMPLDDDIRGQPRGDTPGVGAVEL